MTAKPVETCRRDGCARPIEVKKHCLCTAHYAAERRANRLNTRPYGTELGPIRCETCGETFTPARARQKFCRTMCANRASLMARRARATARFEARRAEEGDARE